MILNWIFLLFFWSNAAVPQTHPLKMTVCDVKYQADKGQLLLKFKFFHDDLEELLEKQAGKALDLTQSTPENEQLIAGFIARNFELSINGAAVKPRLFRCSIQDVVLLAECLGAGFKPASSYRVDLKDLFFLDVFPDQYNIARFDFWGNGNLETLRFEKQDSHLIKQIGG